MQEEGEAQEEVGLASNHSVVPLDACRRLADCRLTGNVWLLAQRPSVSDGMAAEQGLQRTGSAKRRVHNWGVALVVGALSISMSQLLNTFLRDCERPLSNLWPCFVHSLVTTPSCEEAQRKSLADRCL